MTEDKEAAEHLGIIERWYEGPVFPFDDCIAVDMSDLLDLIAAALATTRPQPAVAGEGMALLPMKATPEMIAAWHDGVIFESDTEAAEHAETLADVWNTMAIAGRDALRSGEGGA